MMQAWTLLDSLRALGLAVSRARNELSFTPRQLLTSDLRAAIREQKADLLECLRLEQPAPEWTPVEQAEHDAVKREMALALDAADLLDWLRRLGAEPYPADDGGFRVRSGASVPRPIREVVRDRQDDLLPLLQARSPPAEPPSTEAPSTRQLDLSIDT